MSQLDRIQYSAAKLVTTTLHYTSREKLFAELGWESMKQRADYLGLTLFHKIHCKLTRPLVTYCMPELLARPQNLRSDKVYQQLHVTGIKYRNSFFPYMTRLWNKLPNNVKSMTIDDFKLYLKEEVKPKRRKFYSKGNKHKCSLLTRIRVGRSYLNEHGFSINLNESPACKNCICPHENSLHFICICPKFTELRNILCTKMTEFIPKFDQLSKKRQFEILIFGYDPDNKELEKINTKIMFLTQNFVYDTKRFIPSN